MKTVKIIKICDNCGKTFKTASENRNWCKLKCKAILDQLEKHNKFKKTEQKKSRPKHIIYYPMPGRLTSKIKAIIRERDSFKCQICNVSEDNLKEKLCIYRINNKRNLHPNKLISLCRQCISEKLFLIDKEYWQNFLKEKIKQNQRNKNIKIVKRG